MLLDGSEFHGQIRPALAASWRLRSFDPCRPLCAALASAATSFAARCYAGPDQPLVCLVAAGLPFDRHCWRLLVGEMLLFAAAEVPQIETSPETLGHLLAPGASGPETVPRQQFSPIDQVHFGARDLVFGGGFYRPDHAGYNDRDDVARLARYLAEIPADRWTTKDLAGLPDLETEADREEELAFVREWLPPLQDLYQRAGDRGQIVACERL
jgi:hypothetical protein